MDKNQVEILGITMIKENQKILNALMALIDAGLCLLSILLAFFYHFYNYEGSFYIGLSYYLRLMVAVVPVYFLLYHYFELHESFRHKTLMTETGKIIQANLSGVIFIFVLVFFLKEVHISRMVILLFGVFNTGFTVIFRSILRKILRNMRAKGYNLKHLLLVGWNDVSGDFFKRVSANRNLGYHFIGYINQSKLKLPGVTLAYKGNLDKLGELLDSHLVDEVIIGLEPQDFSQLGGIIEACEKAGVKASLLPFYTKYLPTKPYIDEVEGMPLINIRKIPLDNLVNSFLKRAFDMVGSFLMILMLSPVLLGTVIGIKVTSPGPVMYYQDRIGKNKKPFSMYKFRSMKVSQDGSDMTTWGTAEDNRRTKFGTFIRKFSIDELPQLFNVLRGDMSLVGPRPERPFFVEKFREDIPLYMLKHLVRPGITGWAQINGWRGDTSIEERIKCDIHYIENWNLLLDIKILFLTAFGGIVNKSETL